MPELSCMIDVGQMSTLSTKKSKDIDLTWEIFSVGPLSCSTWLVFVSNKIYLQKMIIFVILIWHSVMQK